MNAPIYLDHAASTPMSEAALAVWNEVAREGGNASSLHASGRRARRRLEEARESIARDLGARPSEVIFTSGGTESNNLAIKGIYWARRAAAPDAVRIIASAVEHHAVIDVIEWLVAHEGAEAIWLQVDSLGRVDPSDLRAALEGAPTALVSIMWANNEIGTLEPVAELARICAEFDVPMHTDAVAAVGHAPIDFASSGAAALSLAAHKFGGPAGAGALLVRRDVAAVALFHGGGQERDLRSGTINVAGAAALAAALAESVAGQADHQATLTALREHFVQRVTTEIPLATLNGPRMGQVLPGIIHFSFAGCEGDALLMLLDAKGIDCSTGSACTAGVASASHVALALGLSPQLARGCLRFSLSATATTSAEIDRAVDALIEAVARAHRPQLVGATTGGK